jgi:hypothetical protein
LEHQPTWLHLQLRDQPLATLDLSQPLAAREALLDQLRGLLIPLCGAALRAVRLPDAVPGDRSGAGMAGANGF